MRGGAWAAASACLVGGGLAVIASGCLITDAPQFKPQQHTAPFLVDASATPDVNEVVVVDNANLSPGTPIKFTAYVVSQDDPVGSGGAFQKVIPLLYIDYGDPHDGIPMLYVIPGDSSIAPGTLDETGRMVSASWYPDMYRVEPGCHRATLIVSHVYDGTRAQCPACNDDYSTITWQVLVCDASLGNCNDLPLTGAGACPTQETSCEAFHAQSGMGAVCPESPDGGTL